MKFKLIISHQDIQNKYQEELNKTSAKITIPGFRKGKAPADLVQKSIDNSKLYESAIQSLLPKTYSDYISKNKLKPLTDPKIEISKAEPNQDWVFDVEIAQAPVIDLINYQDIIKNITAKDSIWTPDKIKNSKDNDEKTQKERKLKLIFDTLLKEVKFDISPLIIDAEMKNSLSRLITQLDQLNLTIQDFVTSQKITIDKLKDEYKKTAEANLKLEFILEAIKQKESISTNDTEVESEINKYIESSKTRVKPTNQDIGAIRYNLNRKKVIDFLLSL